MTNSKGQQKIQIAQRQWFCFYGTLKMILLLVTMFDMVSAASNETNRSDSFAMNDTYFAITSADSNSEESIAQSIAPDNLNDNVSYSPIVNTTVLDVSFNIDAAVINLDTDASSDPNMFETTFSKSPSTLVSPSDTTKLVSVTDTNLPISFSISVAEVHGVSENTSSNISNSETNVTPSTTVETVTNSNITEAVHAIADTNTTSDAHYFDITNPDTIADTSTDTDVSRTISFVTVESGINPIDTDITILHLSSATSTQFNMTDLSSESVNSIGSIMNVSSTVTLSEVTTTNSPTTTAITNTTNITSSTEVAPDIGCALTKCQELYSSNATPLMNVSWRTNNDAEDWATFNGTTAEGRRLANAVHLHELATVEEGLEWTTVCVGALFITSFSHRNSTTALPDVEIKIQTSRDVPVGLVRLRTRCWLATGFFAECSPSFIPLTYIMDLPFYDVSPFADEFWTQLTHGVMEVKSSWIRGINITTFQGSISPQWIFNMNISSLKNLHITGNYWNFTDRFLGDMPKLIHLALTNNSIKSLPEDIFNGMPSLETLILSTNSLSKYPSSISRLFKLLNLDLSNYVGNRNLRIEKESIKLFPRNLRNLKVSNAKLHVNLGDILLLPELRFLNISSNRVKLCRVPRNTSKVEILDVSENNLVKISDNFFSAMPSLKILILNQNHLYGLPNFPKQNNLTHLYASDNLLTSLTRTTFAHLKKLQVLDVSRCRIDFLGTAFVNSISLRSISFSHNLLRDINDNSFSFLPELDEVDFSHNYIKSVYIWKWKLRKLYLSSNRMTNFRTNLSAIEYVDVSYNLIQNIDIVLSSVQILNVSHNSLTYLSPKLWNNISQTLLVDLGGNNFLCCSFQNSAYLSDHFYTEIQNLGSEEPIKCYINTEVSKILFQSEVYDGDLCRSTKESITTFAVVLPIVFTIILAAVLAALTMYVIQFGRIKFIVKHSLDTVVRNTSM